MPYFQGGLNFENCRREFGVSGVGVIYSRELIIRVLTFRVLRCHNVLVIYYINILVIYYKTNQDKLSIFSPKKSDVY